MAPAHALQDDRPKDDREMPTTGFFGPLFVARAPLTTVGDLTLFSAVTGAALSAYK
jgi:hypothetical protein